MDSQALAGDLHQAHVELSSLQPQIEAAFGGGVFGGQCVLAVEMVTAFRANPDLTIAAARLVQKCLDEMEQAKLLTEKQMSLPPYYVPKTLIQKSDEKTSNHHHMEQLLVAVSKDANEKERWLNLMHQLPPFSTRPPSSSGH
jgi:hypothetical protein